MVNKMIFKMQNNTNTINKIFRINNKKIHYNINN